MLFTAFWQRFPKGTPRRLIRRQGRLQRPESLEPRAMLAVTFVGPYSLNDAVTLDTTTVFAGSSLSGDQLGSELFITDGRSSGTRLLRDIQPGVFGSHPKELVRLDSKILFSATDDLFGRELWATDGSDAGTQLLRDLRPGTESSNPLGLTTIGQTTYFFADDGTGRKLWKTDGTTSGTAPISSQRFQLGGGNNDEPCVAVIGTKLVFRSKNELWISDGTEHGTSLLKSFDDEPTQLTSSSGIIYFAGYTSDGGYELWKTDGTSTGTTQIKDIRPGVKSSNPYYLIDATDAIFFTAHDGATGHELWKSDGTNEGTLLVKDIYPGSTGSIPQSLTLMGDSVFFSANDGVTGIELWASNGRSDGTRLVKDIYPGPSRSYPWQLFSTGSALFFTAEGVDSGRELWRTDGTALGTSMVEDLAPGSETGVYAPFFVKLIDGQLHFTGRSSDQQGLWVVNVRDGSDPAMDTTAPTISFRNVLQAPAGSSIGIVAVDFSEPLYGFDRLDDIQLTRNGEPVSLAEAHWNGYGLNYSFDPFWGLNNLSGLYVLRLSAASAGITDVAGNALVEDAVLSWVVGAPPTDIALSASSVAENQPAGTTFGTLSTIDDDTSDSFTYALVAGAGDTDNVSFVIDGHSLLTAANFDFESKNSYSIRVRSVDQGGFSFEKAFTISVTDVDDTAPAITLSNQSPNQDGPISVVGLAMSEQLSGFDAFTDVVLSRNGQPVSLTGVGWHGYDLAFTFQPFFEFNSLPGSYELRISAVTSGITDIAGNALVEDALLSWVVGAPPTDIALSASSVAENQPSGTTVGTLSTIDEDAGDSFTYALVAGTGDTDNASFTIAGNSLVTAASFDFEAKTSYSVRVRSTDQGNLSFEKTFTISVTDVDDAAPVITLSNQSPNQDGPISVVGLDMSEQLSGFDPFTDVVLFRNGQPMSLTGVGWHGYDLAFTFQPFFEFNSLPGAYELRISAATSAITDIAGNALVEDAVLSWVVGAPPTAIALSASSVAENQPAGTAVGTFSTTDEDKGDSFTYLLVAGTGDTDNASFTIVGNSLVTAARFDFETKDALSIRVRATDQAGLSTDQVFTIWITDLFIENGLVGEYRFDGSTSDSSGAGNALTLVGTSAYTTEGRRGGQSLVTHGDRSLYYSTGGHLRAPFLQNLDLQTVTFSFWVRNETTASLYGSNHAAEAYVFASRAGLTGDGTSVMIAPTGPTGLIGTQQVTWADWKMVTLVVESSATLSRYVTYVNGAVAASGEAATDVFPSADVVFGRHYWPTGSSARMDVEWDDMRIFDRALTADEVRSLLRFDTGFPFFTSASSTSIAEDHSLANPIYTAVARDPEQRGITYSIKLNEADSSLVQVDPDTGAVTLLTSADYEARSSYSFTVVGTDADGLSTDHAVTIAITDVDEAPTDVTLSGDTIAENAALGTAVGTLSTIDEDVGDSFTYSLVAGAGDTDNAAFTVDGDTIKTATTFDDEVQSTYRVRLRATDRGGFWTERAFSFAVLDASPPTIGITSGVTKLRAGETATVSFSLSSGTADFVAGDVAVTGGTLSNFQRLSATSYSATFTPSAGFSGTGTVSVHAAAFTNAAGVANDAATPLQFAIDTALPTQPTIARLGAAVTVAGLEPEATWQYSLDGGTTWQAGSSAIFGIPAAEFAANQIQVTQTDKAGNQSPAASLAGGVKIAATPLSTRPFDPAASRKDVRVQAQVDVGTGTSVGLYARYAVVSGKTNLYQAYVSKAGSGFNATIVRFAAGVGAVVKTVAAPSGKGLLEFNVVGSTLSLFLDGKLLTCVVDGSVAGPGTAGTFTTTGASLSQFLSSGLTEPAALSTKSFDGGVSERDMRVQANVDLATGSGVGLYARYSVVGGKVNLYQAYLHKVGADVRATIVRFAAGVGATVTSVVAPTGKGLLQLDVIGSTVSLSLDGKLLTSVTDSSVTGPGTAGTYVAAGATASGFSVAGLNPIVA